MVTDAGNDLTATADSAGRRGYGPRRAVLLGSVSRHLMDEAASPAIVLPRGVEGAFESLLADSGSVGANA